MHADGLACIAVRPAVAIGLQCVLCFVSAHRSPVCHVMRGNGDANAHIVDHGLGVPRALPSLELDRCCTEQRMLGLSQIHMMRGNGDANAHIVDHGL